MKIRLLALVLGTLCCTQVHADALGYQVLCSQVGVVYRTAQQMHIENRATVQQTITRLDHFNLLSHPVIVEIVTQVYFDKDFHGVDPDVVGAAMQKDCLSRYEPQDMPK